MTRTASQQPAALLVKNSGNFRGRNYNNVVSEEILSTRGRRRGGGHRLSGLSEVGGELQLPDQGEGRDGGTVQPVQLQPSVELLLPPDQ